ncbi:hypothetical protein [Peredibacter starrii]|uniref:Uncharacterized protein n=1 Tax=Peredibacter starrii TaxID=28202 RepID=A0AAX4HRX0_9BACT|nr:hypothetical protein [Peredibacter starrii]WPU65853.1 hypothetical protein SOO65_03755 [Peredibacter starrii]
MSPLVKFFVVFLLSFPVLAQSYQFKLEGSFSAQRDTDLPVTVNYTIDWNETSSTIQGVYRDNFYAQKGPQVVSGTVTTNGRSFNTILTEEMEGVKSIVINMQGAGIISGTVPLTLKAQDNLGTVIELANNPGIMTATDRGSPQTGNCVIGFGALTGYCGLYSGNFNEVSDNANRCDISSSGQARIELATNTEFNLYSNYINSINNDYTTIGIFLPSPQSNNVSITGRECGSIPGTTFITGNCKTLNLSGVFYDQASNITFTGTLNMNDEVTGETCTYSLALTREVVY